MGKSDNKKKDKKDNKEKKKGKNKKEKNSELENTSKPPIDTSKLTTAEYEAMFLKSLQEKKNKSDIIRTPDDKKDDIKKPDKKTVEGKKLNQDTSKIIYVRHCQSCNKFIKTDKTGNYSCPKCAKPMIYAIHCDSCNLWFDVKTPKKYPCPKCNKIISHSQAK